MPTAGFRPQTDIQREASDKEKSGVFTGAMQPTGQRRTHSDRIADYVLMTYGTGPLWPCRRTTTRLEIARKFNLPSRSSFNRRADDLKPE